MGPVLFIISMVLTIIPMWKLTEKAGLSPYWSLVCVLPLGLVVLLWIIASRLTGAGSGRGF